MPVLEKDSRKQKAVLWPENGFDEYGEPAISEAVGIDVDVRWEVGNREALDPEGNVIALDSAAVVDREIEPGSLLWLGSIYDVPTSPTNLRRVVDYTEVPDLKGRNVRRNILLEKYNDELPVIIPEDAIGYTVGRSFSIPQTPVGNPFDTIGAVGPIEIVVTVNGAYRVFDKDGVQLETSSLTAFFGALGAISPNTGTFDPRVVYDPFEKRFYAIAVQGGDDSTDSLLYVAVSKTSEPSVDGWEVVSVSVSEGAEHWLDFCMIGFNREIVSISGRLFDMTGAPAHSHWPVYVIPKSDLTQETPTLANMETFHKDVVAAFSHAVVDLDNGYLPHTLWRWQNGTGFNRLDVTAGYTVDAVSTVLYAGASGGDGAQPGAEALDHSVNDRIGTYPVKIGGYVYIVVASGSATGDRLEVFKIDYETNAITAQVTLAVAGLDLIYPAIAVNGAGDIVVGCTATGSAQFASSMVFVGRDEGTVLTFLDGEIVKAGERYYENVVKNRNRWGDYSAVVTDPKNPKVFWNFQTWAFDNGANDLGRKIEVTEVTVD